MTDEARNVDPEDRPDEPSADAGDERTDGVAAVPAGRRGGTARHRRRWVLIAAAAAAVLALLALCVGTVAAVSAMDRFTDRRADDRQDARSRSTACLELERRLNRVTPPGATADPPRRAAAIRAENAALRPYLAELELRGRGDAQLSWWRQLLDARTAYAEALDRQDTAGTPAFFLAPRTPDGDPVADRLQHRAPDGCAAAVRRLAAPDL